MKILIIGAGQVGFFLCERLSTEGHEVTLIDRDEGRMRDIQDRLNVMGIVGNGASAEFLEQAGIKTTDIFIAVTDMDEVNILTCLLAREYKVKTRIGRVRSIEYNTEGAVLSKEKLGIDLLINPDDAVADEIVKLAGRTAAFDVAEFANGQIQFIGYRIGKGSPFCDITLRELGELSGMYRMVVTAISREGKTIIPRGDDSIQEGDSIFIFVHKQDLPAIQYLFQHEQERKKRTPKAFVMGGNRIGLQIAQQLERKRFDVKIIDRDEKRCHELAAKLKRTIVIHAEGTDIRSLMEEGVASADLFVGVTENDETNILASLLSKRHGAKRVMALVSNPDLLNLAPTLGIDACVSPRMSAAAAILKYVRRGEVISMITLEGSNAEVMEIEVKADCKTGGIPLKELHFPKDAIIGAIVRGASYEIPTGESRLLAGDRVLVFALPEAINKVQKYFI